MGVLGKYHRVKGLQGGIKRSSGGHRGHIRWSSKGHQVVIEGSSGGQGVIKWSTSSGLIWGSNTIIFSERTGKRFVGWSSTGHLVDIQGNKYLLSRPYITEKNRMT